FAREGADVLISYLNEHEDAKEVAELVREAGRTGSGGLVWGGRPGGGRAAAAAAAGIAFYAEGFADRAYTPAGDLVARGTPGSVLGEHAALAQAISIAVHGETRDVDGDPVAVPAASLCVHGDSPGAVAMARSIRDALAAKGIEVEAFS
ncbi:LamB/YcsF family protein, partial [Nocardia wallacei]|uniref:LamB/YcsF family protein n=1 Tax=Nocardia wallacei TaxID=480035 RepID=UPI0024567058